MILLKSSSFFVVFQQYHEANLGNVNTQMIQDDICQRGNTAISFYLFIFTALFLFGIESETLHCLCI